MTYKPAAVTEVYDHKGKLMGEIYEQRRYVLPLNDIPKHMQDAFIAAEDAGFGTRRRRLLGSYACGPQRGDLWRKVTGCLPQLPCK